MMEFIDIPEYEGLYKANKNGEILGCKSKKILKPIIFKRGYLRVNLYKNNKHKLHFIHRLVAATFLSKVENKNCINHKNGNKKDNNVNNLEWVTHAENVQHAFDNGLKISPSGINHYLYGKKHPDEVKLKISKAVSGEKNPSAKLTNKQARDIRDLYKIGDYSYTKLAKQFNVSKKRIAGIIKNRNYKETILC